MDELRKVMQEYDVQLAQEYPLPWEGYRVVSILKHTDLTDVLVLSDSRDRRYILKISRGIRTVTLKREYQTLNRLDNRFFPKVFKFTEQDDQAYLLREYIHGITLDEYAGSRQLPYDEIIDLGLEISEILLLLHRQEPPIIHRDIKTQNIIVTNDDSLVLVDFDSVQLHDKLKGNDTILMVTTDTAAPEQFGVERSSFPADVYGIGKVLLFLLCSSTNVKMLKRIKAPLMLKQIIRKATTFDPERRYPSIKKLKAALLHQKNRWRRRAFTFVTAAVLVCVAFFTIQFYLDTQTSKPVLFEEPLIELAAARQLGKEPGTLMTEDLQRVTSLLLIGDQPFDDFNGVTFWEREHFYIAWDINKEAGYKAGDIDSLTDLKMMPNIRELALYWQNISDISVLEGLPLVKLALADNPIYDFSVLRSLRGLRYLDVVATEFMDVSVLTDCAQLDTLHMTQTPAYDISPLEGLPLRELFIYYESAADNIDVLSRLPKLTSLCILRYPDIELTPLGRIKTLTNLEVPNYAGKGLTGLEGLTNLTWLNMGLSAIETLEGIETLSSLNGLSIQGSYVQDLSPLSGLMRLEHLNIEGINLENKEQLNDLPNLKALTVSAGTAAQYEGIGGDTLNIID